MVQSRLGAHLVEDLHRLDHAQGLAGGDLLARLHERRLAGRRLQMDHAVERRQAFGRRGLSGQRNRLPMQRAGRRTHRAAFRRALVEAIDAPGLNSRSVQPSSLYSSSDELGGGQRVDEILICSCFMPDPPVGGGISWVADAFRERVTAGMKGSPQGRLKPKTDWLCRDKGGL